MPLKDESFRFVSEMVRGDAAIVIEAGKEYLVESRLGPLARAEGFPGIDALVEAVRRNPATSPLRYKIVDALTTNETLFFRDFQPFEALRLEVIPRLLDARRSVRKLNIWSAAASTGQESYSLAMLLREHFPQLKDWQVQILGTDLSNTALDQARSGSYSQLEVNRGLPATYLIKYFTKVEERYMVKEELRRWCEFKPMNLIQPWPILPAFDLVFIRNVLIYFDTATKQSILRKMRGVLLPHGLLFLGTAETTINLDPSWVPVKVGKTVAFRHEAAAEGGADLRKAA